jgi:hypothetical protein
LVPDAGRSRACITGVRIYQFKPLSMVRLAMPNITIVVKPAFDSRGRRQHDRFDGHLRDTGELICHATRQPLLDASRVLLSRGYDPSDHICMEWSHKPQIVAMIGILGEAAQFDVMGERFVRRKAPKPDPTDQRRVPLPEDAPAK